MQENIDDVAWFLDSLPVRDSKAFSELPIESHNNQPTLAVEVPASPIPRNLKLLFLIFCRD